MAEWETCPAVESVPGRLSGAWVFKDTRVPVSALFANLAEGATVEDFLDWFPGSRHGRSRRYWSTKSGIWTPESSMRILFDHGTPRPLRDHFPEHRVDTAAEKGWSQLGNGELLDHAERDEYDMMITTDQNMRYQQNLGSRRLAIVVLRSNRWPRIRQRIEAVSEGGRGDSLR